MRVPLSRLFRFPRGSRALVRLVMLAVLLLTAIAAQNVIEGRVISVDDGDSLTVYAGLGERQRIRLYGVDSPEHGQPGGEEARRFTRSLALFSTVRLTIKDKDQYGRYVAVVTLPDGNILNEELLRQGHAWLYGRYCKAPLCETWRVLERDARKAGQGLWSGHAPVPPWQWRREHKRR